MYFCFNERLLNTGYRFIIYCIGTYVCAYPSISDGENCLLNIINVITYQKLGFLYF